MKLYGVFVGVDTYQDRNIRPLQFAKADARYFYDTVGRAMNPKDAELTILTDQDAVKTRVVGTIGEELSRAVSEDDIVLLFFACHGSAEIKHDIDMASRYLIFHDTGYERIFSTGLDLDQELQRVCFSRLRARLVVLFIDACFSGRAGGRTFEGPQLLKRRHEAGTRAMVSLKSLELGEGRLIISAADDTEVAHEYPDLQHGVFTYYLVEALTSGETGRNSIGISLLYEEVSRRVRKYTNGRQNPVINGRSKLGSLPLFANPPMAP